MIQKLIPVLESARIAVENHEPGAAKFLEVHEIKYSRYQKQLEMCEADDIPQGALCALPPISPHDNLLSRTLKWREIKAEELAKKAREDGRIRGYSNATIEKIITLPDVWALETHGLPTWRAVCDFLKASCDLTIRRGALLMDNEIAAVLEVLAVRLLQNPLVQRDGSRRWYWNFSYLTAEVLKDWDYGRLKAPSCTKVANEISRLYPFVSATKYNIEKNKSAVRLIIQKKQELEDNGYLYLSRRGRVLSERKLVADSPEGLRIYSAFSELCDNWRLEDGLPNKETVLSIFLKTYGFKLTVHQLIGSTQLMACFSRIKTNLEVVRFVRYDRINRPHWNVLSIIQACEADVAIVSADSLTNVVRTKFSGLRLSQSRLSRYVSRYLSGERG